MRLAAIGLMAFGLGCGGSDGDSAICEDYAACGGQIVGDWNIVRLCTEEATIPVRLPDNCSDATYEPHLDVSGTIVFTENGDFTISTATTGHTTIFAPASCVPDGLNCEALGDEDTTCTGTGTSGCTCEVAVDESDAKAGTWTISGSDLTLQYDEDDREDTSSYCRSEDTLLIDTEFGLVALTAD